MRIHALVHIRFIITYLCFLIFTQHILKSQTTFTVTSTADNVDVTPGDGICADALGACTLRAAIEEANALAGQDVINFNIPGPSPHFIQPVSNLSSITEAVTIDASTQVPYTFGNPQIVLDGSLIVSGGTGFLLQTNNSIIRGFCIGGFFSGINNEGYGIRILGNNNQIEQNFIGVGPDGVTPFGNEQHGIFFTGATSNNLIGGNIDSTANVISSNGGAGILLVQGFGNIIQGNLIGTDKDGLLPLGNTFGISLAIVNGSGHLIGGNSLSQRNIISANTSGGIFVISGDNFSIQGNYIGTDISGTLGLGNSEYGILLDALGTESILIGGSGAGEGNLISANGISGIDLKGLNNTIIGNLIGTQADGVSPLANGACGIHVEGPGNTIGGSMANIIAYHPGEGIRIQNASLPATNNLISRNSIFGNGLIGIDLGYGGADQGQTLNDFNDPDAGPNQLQNFADIFAPSYNIFSNTLSLSYSIPTDPANAAYPLTIEFFIADASGQGQIFIGQDTYSLADYLAGIDKAISFAPLSPLTIGENLANTVTDAANNTSEFNTEIILAAAPIVLKGEIIAEEIHLSWTSPQETPREYIIEKADASHQFIPIQRFEGQPLLNKYIDLSPKIGENFYRIKLNYPDGSMSYSNEIELNFDRGTQMMAIYPNPAKKILFWEKNSSDNAPLFIQIYDIHGKIVVAKSIANTNLKGQINISELSTGIYWIRVHNGRGKYLNNQKLFIHN